MVLIQYLSHACGIENYGASNSFLLISEKCFAENSRKQEKNAAIFQIPKFRIRISTYLSALYIFFKI